MAKIADIAKAKQGFVAGHRLCAGCAIPIFLKVLFGSSKYPLVLSNATGCLEVASSIYPFSAWTVPWLHSAFENAAATISGAEAMYRVLRKRGEITEEIRFVAIGGDGGTYDIGLQALSGALERGHRFLYICYDNQAYMNTGIQRSSSTPFSAATTTTPAGQVIPGKIHRRKNLTEIVAAHRIPYVAQASIHHWKDLGSKFEKALDAEGPSFINVLSPCVPGWLYEEHLTVEMARLAAETCLWPLYEVENGKYRVNYRPKEKLPISAFIERQGRFRHLRNPANAQVLATLQRQVDEEWEELLGKAKRLDKA